MCRQVRLPHTLAIHQAEQRAILAQVEAQFGELGFGQRALRSANVREQHPDVVVVLSHHRSILFAS